MHRFVRLYGKKRGHRMAGWWLVGRVGEAFWFATLFLVSLLALSTMVAWQVFSPETHPFPVGYGFWLLVLLSSSFAGIGAVGFALRILRIAYSDEHRNVLAGRASVNTSPISGIHPTPMPSVPSLLPFTDSPGVRLAFRLPCDRPDLRELVLSSIFVMCWDALVAVLIAIAIGRLRSGTIEWFSILVTIPIFSYIGYRVSRWFMLKLFKATGIGGTTIEVSDLPMVSGSAYKVHAVQYGKLSMKRLAIFLVCEEVATYHFGTDTRTERQEVARQNIFEQGRCRIDWGRPLEVVCDFRIPEDAMHSFQSPHNSIVWKFIVEGDAHRWPSFCRSFPVVLYPRAARTRKLEAL